jgi:hypothetical protein
MEIFTGIIIGIVIALILNIFIKGFMKGFNNAQDAQFLAGVNRAGKRRPEDVLKDISFLALALDNCKQELLEIVKEESTREQLENEVTKPKMVPIVFNSEEIACKYMGVEVPKYIKDENERWFEFESVAAFDGQNRAIVDDVSADYVTITDHEAKCSFFFKHITEAPVLKEKMDQA